MIGTLNDKKREAVIEAKYRRIRSLKTMRGLTPWQKIVRAAEQGRGARLSADEVLRLAMDGAIETRAENDWLVQAGLEEEEL